MIIKLKNGDKLQHTSLLHIRKMQTAAGGPLFPWLLNTEWIDNWKFRTTPASRSRVLSGKGVETDKQYTERRKKETTKRTWRSNAADIAHGIGEGVLALHPYTAIPYFGAKVGLDFLNGTYGWHTALNASVPLFHLAPQAVGLREATNVALEDAANAGSKTAKTYLISRELKSTIKKGLKPAPSKTDNHPYDIDDLISNYNGGKQNLESWWLDRELTTGNPNKLVHFDNGDFKPHFWKHDIHGNKVKGAYINDGKLVPSGEGELLKLWWSPGKPFLDSHFRYEQSSNWGLPKRYITVDRNASNFELMYLLDPITMRPIPGDEILSNGPVDLSNASIIQKSPFGWWERVKSYKSSSDWTKDLPGKRDYSMPRKPSYSGYTPTKLNPAHSKFVKDVMLGYKWGMNRETKPIGNRDFTEELKGKERLGYGAENDVYKDASNPNQVLKVPGDRNGLVTPHSTPLDAIREGLYIIKPFNRLPYNLPLNIEGTMKTVEGKYIPVFSLRKVYIPLMDQPKIVDFDKSVNGMYSTAKPDINNILLENDIQRAKDFKLPNIGFLSDGTVMGIDLWKKGGKMKLLFLKNGSGIHIKKKNRGKFTAYCGGNVTSACIQKAKRSGNKTLIKRATFALNARKWKH